ncbi:hypothetical protein THASP1DRAFT_27014 [Thamnocephalis sphaerospora]|uniref:F-box domain-containing protein n=1 Tax=Thamnocephalis sphaerospora TaxID=78915 RepID=A0A4P9XXQ8_9FUNG|nr:hypothetical protein THASP1DRAFT_27014 [Thamnocephalis sphaerospora]|eukprot:RKP11178.1 hypothetical protein THASP1DRAFT_27014 [Thamnocephalis sphaerospora]
MKSNSRRHARHGESKQAVTPKDSRSSRQQHSRLALLPAEVLFRLLLQMRDPAPFTCVCRRVCEIAADPVFKARYLLMRADGCVERAAQRGLRYRFFDTAVLSVLDRLLTRTLRQRRRLVVVMEDGYGGHELPTAQSTAVPLPPSSSHTLVTGNKRARSPSRAENWEGASKSLLHVSLAGASLPHGMFMRASPLAEHRALTRIGLYLDRGGYMKSASFAVALAAKRGWARVVALLLDRDRHGTLLQASARQSTNDSKRVRASTSMTDGLAAQDQPGTPAELALVHCATVGNMEILELLLDHGVRPCSESLQGAVQGKHWAAVQRLVDAGAVPDMDTLELLTGDGSMMDMF